MQRLALVRQKSLCYDGLIQYRTNNQIKAPEVRVIDEHSQNLGVLPLAKAIDIAREKGLDLIEISATANPPVARIMDFDKFRYQKEKEDRKQRQSQKANELKQVRITPRAALNDLRIKAKRTDEFLEDGHKVEVSIFLRGREKGNKDWALAKLEEFLKLISVEHQRLVEPKKGGRGFITQIAKK
ncbi:MAG: Translation initiation factor IF-3 [Candidatus Jorgensenbacteria bacterium GW2011_GWA2_45_13]|uniref:Translation initiation factor IF-3 n=1 Tax=Candidatus Jorgensenbacteria bacterium GW2011_GWA2_45_13 TaxID=1618662 RepID=A0A0G1NDL5_9BACT|nr:MAG: Translation initiation factor IF-3 [Candidatus Jorgensenbacteria bacterium GW2011_GWA2_45_13]